MADRYQEPVFAPSALDYIRATAAGAWKPFTRPDGRYEVARVIDSSLPGGEFEFSRTPAGAIRSFPTDSIAISVCRLLNGEYR